MKVVVTGGAGFIGANLVRDLLEAERIDEVAVVDDLSSGFRGNLDEVGADLREGSILDGDLLDDLLQDADAVVHLAARPSVPRSIADPMTTHDVNVNGTLSVLEAVRRAGQLHLIVASSSSVYGANPTLPKSEDLRTAPLSPYAVSKLATENYALAYGHCYELPVLAFRFFNVFGPLQSAKHAYAAAIPTFLDAALRGLPIPVDGDGGQTRDFTYVGSLSAVVVDALVRKTTADGPINLAFGSRRTILEVVSELEDLLGTELVRDHRPPRAGDVRHSQADQTRLEELFPDIEPVDFRTGLEQTVEWFRTLPEYG